jgi:hypothetical protein
VPKSCKKALIQLRKEVKKWRSADTGHKKADYAAAIAAWEEKWAREGRSSKKHEKPNMPP